MCSYSNVAGQPPDLSVLVAIYWCLSKQTLFIKSIIICLISLNKACEIGCRMWRSSRCGRATTLFARLLKQTTTKNYFTKNNLSVTVSQRHRQLSAARCGRATTLFAKLLKQTTSNYFTKCNLSVTVSQRHRHLSEEIFYDSLGIGIQIGGGAKSAPRCPRIWLPTFDVIILEAIAYKVNGGIQIRGGSKSGRA